MKKIEIKETYRIDSEENVKKFIEECKTEAEENGYEISSYSSTQKVKKSKGEIVDLGYQVVVTKKFNDFWEV